MNDLLNTYHFLQCAMQADPLLSLAYCVAALDPMCFYDEDDDLLDDTDGSLSTALHVMRANFPDLYCEAVEALRNGADYAQVDRLICADLTDRGLPVDAIEFLGFGIPLPAYGAELEDPEFYAAHLDYAPVLAWFGILPEPGAYTVNVPDRAYTAGRLIAADLVEHENADYQNIGWLLGLLFSCTGNSSADWSDEMMAEIPPLSWDRADVEFAMAIIEEAEEIMGNVERGLAFLLENDAMQEMLRENIRHIYNLIERQNGEKNAPRIQLKWP